MPRMNSSFWAVYTNPISVVTSKLDRTYHVEVGETLNHFCNQRKTSLDGQIGETLNFVL
jgi:hypothetical protein